ncbi:hotdog family protein [Massilia sp. P8910]|uniref:Hotdog family protein n=1 Tax=Massilia antarctica TaxID=2765360 RepID=A0AA48WAT0_9BURK|nr:MULTISPECIES: hotdog family protein [Massilia]MCE3602329.1 hotdog family protein [Massilia antarctica]MCY0912503.1 hotdog family protein [Massilia sp. H27-R4]QPI49136.1 hotdog family protein [Massilia antarctica]
MNSDSYPDIRALVPHEGEMVFLDRVLTAGTSTLCAEVTISQHSVFFDATGAEAGVGSWVGIEYMAQAIAAQAGFLARLRGDAVRVGFLLGARRYQTTVPLFALGSVLHVHVQHVLQGENGLGAFDCRIDDGASGANLANATITVFQPDNVNEFLQRSF